MHNVVLCLSAEHAEVIIYTDAGSCFVCGSDVRSRVRVPQNRVQSKSKSHLALTRVWVIIQIIISYEQEDFPHNKQEFAQKSKKIYKNNKIKKLNKMLEKK